MRLRNHAKLWGFFSYFVGDHFLFKFSRCILLDFFKRYLRPW